MQAVLRPNTAKLDWMNTSGHLSPHIQERRIFSMKEVYDVYAHHHGDGVAGGSSDAHR